MFEVLPPGPWSNHKPLYVKWGINEDPETKYQTYGIEGRHAGGRKGSGAEGGNKNTIGIDLNIARGPNAKGGGGYWRGQPALKKGFNNDGGWIHTEDQLKGLVFLVNRLRGMNPTIGKKALQGGKNNGRKEHLSELGLSSEAAKKKWLDNNQIGVLHHAQWTKPGRRSDLRVKDYFRDQNMDIFGDTVDLKL